MPFLEIWSVGSAAENILYSATDNSRNCFYCFLQVLEKEFYFHLNEWLVLLRIIGCVAPLKQSGICGSDCF